MVLSSLESNCTRHAWQWNERWLWIEPQLQEVHHSLWGEHPHSSQQRLWKLRVVAVYSDEVFTALSFNSHNSPHRPRQIRLPEIIYLERGRVKNCGGFVWLERPSPGSWAILWVPSRIGSMSGGSTPFWLLTLFSHWHNKRYSEKECVWSPNIFPKLI